MEQTGHRGEVPSQPLNAKELKGKAEAPSQSAPESNKSLHFRCIGKEGEKV